MDIATTEEPSLLRQAIKQESLRLDVARRQMLMDRTAAEESTKNFHRVEGGLAALRALDKHLREKANVPAV